MTKTTLSDGTVIKHRGAAVFSAVYDSKLHGDLLPCPFCGGKDLEVTNTSTPSYWVECHECEGRAHGASYVELETDGTVESTGKAYVEAMKSAIAAWNRRA